MKSSEFYFLIIFALLLFSCKAKPKNNSEQESDKLEAQRKINIQSIADSTVNLSFCGIVLGQPLEQTITSAKKNGKIQNVKYQIEGNDKSATCSAILILPNEKDGLKVDVKVCSFQDTITSFIILSNVEETYKEIIDLYKNKYNKDFCENEDISGSYSWIWTFKNQSLRVSIFYTEKEKNFRYFAMNSIIYSDLYQVKKVEAYESKINKKKQIVHAPCETLKNINDSILRVKREKRALQQEF